MSESLASVGKTQLRYERWAVEQVFAAIAQLPQEQVLADRGVSFGSIHGTLLHIYQADSIWFARLKGDMRAQPAQFVAPVETGALKQEWTKLMDRISDWAEQYPSDGWSSRIEYFNSQGKKFETPVWQIVLHAVNHATGHMGQVIGILRQSGFTPPSIDMIRFYRLEDVQRLVTG